MPYKDPVKRNEYSRELQRTPKWRAYQKAYRKKHRKKILKYLEQWRKKNPFHDKEWQDKNRRKKNANQKRWRLKNMPYVRATNRAREAKEKTSINKAGGFYTTAEWKKLCRKYKHRCLRCKKRRKLTADHVVPISKGGTSAISNIQPLCRACNSKKHTKSTDYRKGFNATNSAQHCR